MVSQIVSNLHTRNRIQDEINFFLNVVKVVTSWVLHGKYDNVEFTKVKFQMYAIFNTPLIISVF